MRDAVPAAPVEVAQSTAEPAGTRDVSRLRDLSPQQWRSGIAAWLGWLFDGLDMHLYTLVATPFVAQLLQVGETDALVTRCGSLINAAFLLGWAFGGGFFGRLGDRLGRAHALMLTILTYAMFTGLSFVAQTWWQLLICRFLAALGIGGEWAVGAALLSETWPRRWRPWIAGALQSAVDSGVMVAMVAGYFMANLPYRCVFLVGILPALVVVWIRRSVPEPEEWHAAKLRAVAVEPRVIDLFRGNILKTTVLTILVCSFSLTGHWAMMYFYLQHLRNLPDLTTWSGMQKTQFLTQAMLLMRFSGVTGNFLSAGVAKLLGYRRAIALLCVAYFLAMLTGCWVPRNHIELLWWCVPIGMCQGVFGLFTMYLPPLFPTLLRTTGAGFCFNIGRIAAAAGTVFFGLFSHLGDHRLALLYASFLFLPAAGVAMLLSEPPDEAGTGPFFGEKGRLAHEPGTENMDLSPSAAPRGTVPCGRVAES